MGLKEDYHSAFVVSFSEFFGPPKDYGWETYLLSSDTLIDSDSWLHFTVRNPFAGRSLVFRYHIEEKKFYAFLKVQVIPGEENWNLDTLFRNRGYTDLDAQDILQTSGEWKFHSLARHYFGIILSYCPRILEPDEHLY